VKWLVLVVLCGCTTPGPDPSRCVTKDAGCTPAYDPTFANVWSKTLQPTCASTGVSCHASTGKQGGIVFDSEAAAYDTLRAQKAYRAGDPACSEIVFRMASTDPYVRMPPGATLDPAEQCAIAQWIAAGAKP
jgi:hypothetical protein